MDWAPWVGAMRMAENAAMPPAIAHATVAIRGRGDPVEQCGGRRVGGGPDRQAEPARLRNSASATQQQRGQDQHRGERRARPGSARR